MRMTAYYMNDGVFDLPEAGFVDHTMTQLLGKFAGDKEVVVRVERRSHPAEKSLRELVAKQTVEVRGRLRDYTVISEREVLVAQLPAMDISARWRAEEGEPFYTRRGHLSVRRTWILLACESVLANRHLSDACMDRILASFRLRA
jgi:hypothetical protein